MRGVSEAKEGDSPPNDFIFDIVYIICYNPFKGGITIKEYGIYIRQGSGTPYMIHFFNNIDSAKSKLYEMVQLEIDRARPYFVDNDFFDNQYTMSLQLKYFCIKEREVTEWSNYSDELSHLRDNNKIIYFNEIKNK